MKALLFVTILLFTPALAQAQTIDKVYGWGIVANAVAHAADASSTVDCSARRTCIEKNPWLAPFQSRPTVLGITKTAMAATKTYMIHRYVWKKGKKKTAIAMIAIDTIVTSLIANNNRKY